MENADDMLSRAVGEGVEVFKQDYVATGYSRSGASLESIKADGNTITGHISVSTLIFGRGPSEKYPPWGYERGSEIPTSLMQWCMNVLSQTTKQARSTSFLVARKIKTHGNQVYQGLKPPIPTEGTVDAVSEAFMQGVMNDYDETIEKNDI